MKCCLFAFAAMIGLLVGCTAPPPVAGEVRINEVFDSNMVLQRDRPIRIFGEATPDSRFFVGFRDDRGFEFSGEVRSDSAGRWETELPGFPADGRTWTLLLKGAGAPRKLDNILFGEVWFCSGQSNMEFTVGQVYDADFWIDSAENYPQIRIYRQDRITSPVAPRLQPEGTGWQLGEGAEIRNFSAVGYIFGRLVADDLKVPVGLIDASWGGSRLEPWIPDWALRPKQKAQLDEVAASVDQKLPEYTMEDFYRWNELRAKTYAKEAKTAENWRSPDLDESEWLPFYAPNTIEAMGENIDGVFWLRKSVDIPEEWNGKDLTLFLNVIDDCDDAYFNGELVGRTDVDTIDYWGVVRQYTIPGKLVKPGKAVLALRITDHAGTGGFTRGGELYLGCGEEKLALNGPWKYRIESVIDNSVIGERPWPGRRDPDNYTVPGTLYNGMTAPWTKFPVRGVLFYQGCSNVGDAAGYALDFPLLIASYRKAWGEPDMPFIFAQISSLERFRQLNQQDFALPAKVAWSELQYAQQKALELPKVAMVATSDVGDRGDIHPRNKTTVAERFKYAADRLAYDKSSSPTSPVFSGTVQYTESDTVISFDNLLPGAKLVVASRFDEHGLPLEQPEEADLPVAVEALQPNGSFVFIPAKISQNQLIMSGIYPRIRYAWADYPVNLDFQNGVPVAPNRFSLYMKTADGKYMPVAKFDSGLRF